MFRNILKIHKLFTQLMEPKKSSTARRDRLIGLQQRARLIWNRNQYFVVEPSAKPKYFQTFPFPYMNGKLHLGHAFSMTKCDFNAWFKRLCGYNVLFPFGFHCTGMPISAAAKKLSYELAEFGNPPVLPPRQEDEPKYQYPLMLQLGVPASEIADFTDANHWIDYFTPRGQLDLSNFGVHVDRTRSFITTDRNPYFDSFIRWQFTLLKEKGYIKFGKRPSIYSPKDKQMCADHDRQEGEGVVPDQYTLIKIRILELNAALKEKLEGRNVFLVAATLRPETMYGQTSCYLLPTGDYSAVEMKNNQVFICSQKSALNMAYQGLTRTEEKVEIIAVFRGEQLLGLPLKAPLSVYERVYSLPMMTISMKKGTGVVSCVPSDSPDDWMAISDLRSKKALREKYNISEEMVGLNPIEIIKTPYGNLTALAICEKMKIKSQNDKDALQKAKEQCYKKGFFEGTMLIGSAAGVKVTEAKALVRKEIIDNGDALIYYEPNGVAKSRSGDECVVAYCDQWYINYADPQWKERVLNYVTKTFKSNSETLHNDLLYTIGWLREWGCSRSFGLGTKLPFDPQYLIESLSDSTIYFAYYTISHMLQGNIVGSVPGLLGIRPEEITLDFWNYVLLGQPYTSNKVSQHKLDTLRNSFLYWYPLDLRCSAKDLIKNHLTMALFNHAAIWDDEKYWPRAYYCNGYINVEGEKMSKSLGNFITLEDSLKDYGADASRMACAQAGDSINDANFTKQNANAAIMQLSTLEMYLSKVLEHFHDFRQGEPSKQVSHVDNIFRNEIEDQICKVYSAYENMVYRDVVKYGLHDFVYLKDLYVLNCDTHKPSAELIVRYIYLQLLFLYPLCPHFCETAYMDFFLALVDNPMYKSAEEYPKLLGDCRFPKSRFDIDRGAIRSHQYYLKLMIEIRESVAKMMKPKKGQDPPKLALAIIIYRHKFQPYQLEILQVLKSNLINGAIRENWREDVKAETKEEKTKKLKFGGFIEKQFKTVGPEALEENLPHDELRTLHQFAPNMEKELGLKVKFVEVSEAPKRQNKGWEDSLASVTPGNPLTIFE